MHVLWSCAGIVWFVVAGAAATLPPARPSSSSHSVCWIFPGSFAGILQILFCPGGCGRCSGLVRARCWCGRLAGNCWCSLLVAVVCCVWGVCITVLCAPLVCSRRCFMVLAMAPRLLASHAAFCAPSCRHGCSSRCGSFCVGVQRCGLSQLSRVVLSSVCGRLLCVPVAVSSQQAGSPWVVVWLPGHQCDSMVFWTCGGCVVSQIVMDQHRRAGQHCQSYAASLLVCACGAKAWRCNKLSWLGAMHGLTRSCIC